VKLHSASSCDGDLRSLSKGFRIALLIAVVVACGGDVPPDAALNDELSAKRDENLLTAYGILSDSLGDEASLKWLLLLKNVTLHGPAEEVKNMMKTIQKAANKRSEEMKKLRLLDPPLVGEAPHSAMGDAIQRAATEVGMVEMIFPDGKFNVRFLFLQAQATRMISVVAEQAAKFDPNKKREKWLRDVAHEFEGYRDELVQLADSCSTH